MENVVPFKIQLISIIGTVLFMVYIIRLIVRGRLREEYAIIWIICTLVLLTLSFWRRGLETIALELGVYYPPSLLFLFAIGAIVCFLVHLSVVNSKMQHNIKELTQELALIRHELNELKRSATTDSEADTGLEVLP
ncbi:hypothetical protein BN8_06279 [Fibrisoma limi BUZ 3]|uniref:DUF2304 domain-containing protein n=1 Tax=Fibrisoma limi BUZ 3 TaxID=1185876 RepID=I2GSL0_9BACT|nr:DUF2304 domain-containing protein [Fibrisoma limi]CCH56889.1 hypothetical protein BN8_06279 [Fibrisoma limi BUZ 3]